MSTAPENQGEWISQAEAARIHGVSRQAISKMVQAGRLRSFPVGGRIFVSRAEVVALDRLGAPLPREQTDEAGRFLASLDQLPDHVRREVLRRLKLREPAHPIEDRLHAPTSFILDALNRSGAMMLRGLRGVLAESAFSIHVVAPLLASGWSETPLAQDPPYDFQLDDGRGPIRVQVKLQRSKAGQPMLVRRGRHSAASPMYVVETQRTRGGTKLGSETRPYRFGEFDILVVSVQPATGDWSHFRSTVANWLITRPEDKRQLAKFQPVAIDPNDDWTDHFAQAVAWFRSGDSKTIQSNS